MQGAEKNFAAQHMVDMTARNLFRNAAVGWNLDF